MASHVDRNMVLKASKNNYKTVEILKPTNTYYRIGDMVSYVEHRKDPKMGKQYHFDKFPNSIASDYMHKTDGSNDIKTLVTVVKKHKGKYMVPASDTFVMHLRVGDVIDEMKDTVEDFLYENPNDYVANLNKIERMLRCAKRKKKNKISIVYGVHSNGKFPKTRRYLAGVCEYCRLRGFTTSLVTHSHADEALIYMANASVYAPSGGGFSSLIARLVRKFGGSVCRIGTSAYAWEPKMNWKHQRSTGRAH